MRYAHAHTLGRAGGGGNGFAGQTTSGPLGLHLGNVRGAAERCHPASGGQLGTGQGDLSLPGQPAGAVQPPCTRVSRSDTARQCLEQTTVLVVQDTTSLNLTGCHVLPELGPIGSGNLAQGVLLHSTLALTEQGAVLGVLGLQTWARPAGDAPGPAAKESGKWLHGIDQARQVVWETAWAAGAAAPPRLMHLMDREGDVYEVLQWVEEVGDSAIIRCVQNRRVEEPLRLAHAAVRAQPVLGRVTLTVPRSHGKSARTATVEMRALTTTLRPDRKKYPHAWPLTWTLVEVWEPTSGAGMRGPALVVVDAGARYDAAGGAGGRAEIYLPLADRGVSLDAEERLSHRGLAAGKAGTVWKRRS